MCSGLFKDYLPEAGLIGTHSADEFIAHYLKVVLYRSTTDAYGLSHFYCSYCWVFKNHSENLKTIYSQVYTQPFCSYSQLFEFYNQLFVVITNLYSQLFAIYNQLYSQVFLIYNQLWSLSDDSLTHCFIQFIRFRPHPFLLAVSPNGRLEVGSRWLSRARLCCDQVVLQG